MFEILCFICTNKTQILNLININNIKFTTFEARRLYNVQQEFQRESRLKSNEFQCESTPYFSFQRVINDLMDINLTSVGRVIKLVILNHLTPSRSTVVNQAGWARMTYYTISILFGFVLFDSECIIAQVHYFIILFIIIINYSLFYSLFYSFIVFIFSNFVII